MTRRQVLRDRLWMTAAPSLDGAVPLRQSPNLTPEEQAAMAAFPARRFEGGEFRDMARRTLVDAGHEVDVYTRLNGTVWKIDGRAVTPAQALKIVNALRRRDGREPLTLDGGGDA